MFFSWRLEDTNLSTFSHFEKNQINSFQKFVMCKPDGFCSVCMMVLYPDEQKYREFDNPKTIPCL
ncbi:hypothetical protein BD770DRAFT_378346, partial [Pilaira anomala]